jgi:hypothetical protein
MAQPSIVHSDSDEHLEHEHHPQSFWSKYAFSVDHKMIAMQYMFTGMAMGIIGGFFSYVFRMQMAFPGHHVPGFGVVTPNEYNMLITNHGTIMIFWLAMPVLVAAFGNFLISLNRSGAGIESARLEVVLDALVERVKQFGTDTEFAALESVPMKLTFALMDPPFESERTTTFFRLLALAATRGYEVNVFAYEGAVHLAFDRQKPHGNSVHGTDVPTENHPLPKDWLQELMTLAQQHGGRIDWVNCGLCGVRGSRGMRAGRCRASRGCEPRGAKKSPAVARGARSGVALVGCVLSRGSIAERDHEYRSLCFIDYAGRHAIGDQAVHP